MIELIIGIIGVILTIGFGIYSLKKMKGSTPKVELSFVKNECFSLVDESYNKLGLDVRYKEAKITNPIILLKATLSNIGSLDIDKNMIFQPLKIISSEKYKWLEAKVLTAPENANIEANIVNSNILVLNWDLLKEQEFIEVEMVIEQIDVLHDEVPSTIYFYDNIYFEHRITSLKNIRKNSYVGTLNKSNIRYVRIWLILGLVYLFAGTSALVAPELLSMQDIVYKIQDDSSYKKVHITPKKNNILVLENIEYNANEKLNIDEFNNKYSIASIELGNENRRGRMVRMIGIILFIGAFFLFRLSYIYFTIYRKLKTASNT